jgi:alkaline phosphatase
MSTAPTDASARSGVNRRSFLKTGALGSLFLGSGAFAHGGQAATTDTDRITHAGDAKNVIFLVSDGMSIGTLCMADLLLSRRDGRHCNWGQLYQDDRARQGLMDMASLNSIVTGSAAAASSWGSGHRVNNTAVNMSPDGEVYRTICEIFRDAGKGTGLVTTARMTHATPAGFGINMEERWSEDAIAEQYLERAYDVLLGGGARHFDADRRDDGIDLFGGFREQGYTVARTKADLMNWNAQGRILGTFFDSHVPYTLDHINTPEYARDIPTLAEMTDRALERLSENDNGFILQVEGGRVDHAAHSNDSAGLVYDQIAFDDAIGRALAFAEGRDDTLIIIASDHGNANPGVNGIGDGYSDSNAMFDTLQDMKYTNNWILAQLDEQSTYREIQETVEEAWQFPITRRQAHILQEALRGTFQAVYEPRSRPSAVLSAIQANYTAVNWIGSMHTTDYVELTALGPGSEAIGQFTRNTQLFDVMVEAAGVREYARG